MPGTLSRSCPAPDHFPTLVAQVQACRRCPAMEGRRRVLSSANGPVPARVLFLAEAPGRRGGEITGIPLSRDASGQRFTRLLSFAGLTREQVFISNVVLCNPRDPAGRNRPPARAELDNCAGWLRAQLATVDPEVVVTLGAVALAALDRIERHGLTLRTAVAQPVPWSGRTLFPLYHPSPRAGLSRPYPQQDDDFRALARLLATHPPPPSTHAILDSPHDTPLAHAVHPNHPDCHLVQNPPPTPIPHQTIL